MTNFQEIKEIYDRFKTSELSEIDTQILFIEPVIQISAWNIKDPTQVKRASRSTKKQEFDIEIYREIGPPRKLHAAFECKSISSHEFNIDKINSRNGIGQLTQKQRESDQSLYWVNKSGDGTGQLRAYCINYSHFNEDTDIPILTNGFDWVVFDNSCFLEEKSLSNKITEDHIKARGNINDTDFEEKIIKMLKKTTYRDRKEPHSSSLPHHRTNGSVYGDSADQGKSGRE